MTLNVTTICGIIGSANHRLSNRSIAVPSNAAPIVQQVQQDFQALLAYLTGPAAQTQTAYTVEVTLFRRLLALGAALLRLFFITRAAARPAAPTLPDGTLLAYHDQRLITYYSVFGKLRFPRHYFTAPGQPGCCPLDATLSLPNRCYSDLLREWTNYDATDGAYRETADSIAPYVRTPTDVRAALLHEKCRADHPIRPLPVQKETRATLQGKAAAMQIL